MNWQSKVAVVTGGGSGIGEAMALRLAAEGMRLVIADVNRDAAEKVAAAIQAGGGVAFPVQTDVSRQDALLALADFSWSSLGAVDLVCANAGVVPSGRYRPVWDYPLEDWEWALGVNLMGLVHTIRAFIPRMIEQATPGHFVTTASVAGLVSGAGSAVYSTSKHGAVRVTEALYASLKEKNLPIGVTLLCPGVVNTKIYQSERNRPNDLMPPAGIAEETPELQSLADDLFRNALTPEAVADQVMTAVQTGQFYCLTSDSYDRAIGSRTDALLCRANPEFTGLLDMVKADVPAT